MQVLCTNPASLGGGSGLLDPSFPVTSSKAKSDATPWISYPGRYRASCQSSHGATWLQVTPVPGDTRPVLTQAQGPQSGLHVDDVNVAMGNLIHDVASEEASLGLARAGS